MVQEIDSLYRITLSKPLQYYYLNTERAAEVRRQIAAETDDPHARLQTALAVELLNAGQTEAAIDVINRLIDQKNGRAALSAESRRLNDMLAIAYLRLGEEQNCIGNHAAEACILPLQGGGIHKLMKGSSEAIPVYQRLLDVYQNDYRSRWLMNVAYMTLGHYPHAVPGDVLIPGLSPAAGLVPRFPNIAADVGLHHRGLAGGISIEDFNNDGFLDLFITSHRLQDTVRFLLNDGKGGFIDQTYEAGIAGLAGGLNVVHADYNNDGFVDILILRGAWLGPQGGHPNSLLKNNGDGTFKDVTVAAGLRSYHPTQTAAWGDFNNDGWLDLYIGNERSNRWLAAWQQSSSTSDAVRQASELYMNNGDGTFTDVAPQLGLDAELFVKGVAWGDANNDGLPDLYLSVMGGPNRFYMNRGGTSLADWQFEEVAGPAGVHEPFFSFPVWFWDFDNDGWLDLCVGNSDLRRLDHAGADLAREYLGLPVQTEMPRIYRNNGDETFTDVTTSTGMNHVLFAMGGNYGDLDNDGFEDMYFGTGAPDFRSLVPNRMFLNRDGAAFEEVTLSGGFGHLQKGHGIAFGDLDRDGDQDIYAVMGGAYEGDVFQDALFENPGSATLPAWTVLELVGERANASAIGARVQVTVTRQDGTERRLHRVVSTGGSFGASSLQLEIGLGDAVSLDEVRIIWPDAERSIERHTALALNRAYRLKQGDALVTRAYEAIPFRKDSASNHVHQQ